ncbi:MAG: GNAT family N-acetyltransferase [Pseudomonadota bacterium]
MTPASDTMDIHRGLPKGFEAAAAALYWQAFEGKLSRLMGPADRAQAFFTETINPAAVIAAIEGDALLGVAAFKHVPDGFSTGGMGALWRHYGPSSLWRAFPLALLERKAPAGVLQMDGICVAAAARGRGVGTALLNGLFDYARDTGFQAVTLDVIDRNPRARALYERIGFAAQGQHSAWPLRGLLGFDYATRMVKTL